MALAQPFGTVQDYLAYSPFQASPFDLVMLASTPTC